MPLQIAPGMMVGVADNEQPSQPNQPVPYDPEQQRQFEQFQQYQQFLRFQESQGQLPPSATPPQPQKPKGRPWWQTVLRSKMFRKLVLLVVVLIGLTWAYDYYFGPDPDDSTVQGGAGPGTPEQQLKFESPDAGIRTLYGYAAAGQTQICQYFEPAAAIAFAQDFGVSDCKAAIRQLAGQVDGNIPKLMVESRGRQYVTVSSCADLKPRVNTKRLGRITFHKQPAQKEEWMISGHEPEPDPCPVTTTTAPTTAPSTSGPSRTSTSR